MLWLEGHKHELNPLGFATLQSWKYRIDLMSGRRHHYEIIGSFLVQFVGDAHIGTLTRFEHDASVSLQLLEPKGIWARNYGHIVAGTSQLVREGTTDFTGTDDGNRQRRFGVRSGHRLCHRSKQLRASSRTLRARLLSRISAIPFRPVAFIRSVG